MCVCVCSFPFVVSFTLICSDKDTWHTAANAAMSAIAFAMFAIFYTEAGSCLVPQLSKEEFRNIPLLIGAFFGMIVTALNPHQTDQTATG